jgi:sulfate adenylyltransferase subunit 2
LSTNKTVISHLRRLEAESIHIMREVAAEFANPVMLYSIGKDSSVMLHLAMKAFYPSKPPFPLMHVDTTWKFREMIEFRDETARRLGLDLIVHVNQDGVKRGINPFDSGSSLHTQGEIAEADLIQMQGLARQMIEGVHIDLVL